jgi:mannose-6-phosphate isomerase-like protein (cupin superfamily)
VLIPKLMAATEKFDMIPVRDKAQFDPQPWDGSEVKLPGVCENGGYYLKEGAGDKWTVGGMVVRPMATRKETNDRFSICTLEASSLHAGKGLGRAVKFEKTHHAIYTVDGVMKLTIDGSEASTTVGETTFVPAGTSWTIEAASLYARVYVFANGGGLGEILTRVGTKYEAPSVPSEVASWEEGAVAGLEAELGFSVL